MFEMMEFMQLGFIEWLIPSIVGLVGGLGGAAISADASRDIARKQRAQAAEAERNRQLGMGYDAPPMQTMGVPSASPGIATPNFRFETDASQYALENMYRPR